MKDRQPFDRERPCVVSFSGGKDSVATWLYLTRELCLPNIVCVFADTGHEAEQTYAYLDLLEREHGLSLVRVQGQISQLMKTKKPEWVPQSWLDDDLPLTMERLCVWKRRFPSATHRFCTTELKLVPLRRYVEQYPDCVMVSGVRAEESPRRANLATWAYDDFMSRDRWLPIHGWSHRQVFGIHNWNGVPVNPLYLQGCSRVGCWPCIHARKSELASIALRHPECFERLTAMERHAAQLCGKPIMTFFSRDKTALEYRSHVDAATGLRVADAEDVLRWALGAASQYPQDSMFANVAVPLDEGEDLEAEACSSAYGLCE